MRPTRLSQADGAKPQPRQVTYNLLLPAYPIKPFEREIAKLEALHLSGVSHLEITPEGFRVTSSKLIPEKSLRRLGSFAYVELVAGNVERPIETDQHILEMTGRSVTNHIDSRLTHLQVKTRPKHYLLHELHSYKGRYYPQLIKPLINTLDGSSKTVLDPFVGCGTTLIESKLASMNSIGVDLNPIACFISQVKMKCFDIDSKSVVDEINRILPLLRREISVLQTRGQTYLESFLGEIASIGVSATPLLSAKTVSGWFSPGVLEELLLIRSNLEQIENSDVRDFALLALSSIVKRVSNWDPGSIRQQLAKTPRHDVRVLEIFRERLERNISMLKAFESIRGRLSFDPEVTSKILQGDSRKLDSIADGSIDMVITSPPYATALPYIDTDRLPMYVMGLLRYGSINSIKNMMIGERDISDRERTGLETEFLDDYEGLNLPSDAKELIRRLLNSNGESKVGFRRRNVPANLYRYFRGMRDVISEMKRVLKPSGRVAIVIGDNFTMAGGTTKVEIPTTRILKEIAEGAGFTTQTTVEMTPTPLYTRYADQMIQKEYIIAFKN
jgi:site-specific DNA-methyltransferase (cytosine-N4-specific)